MAIPVTKECKVCRDEREAAGRPAVPAKFRACPHPGPRCVTHHRAFRKAQKARTHDARVQRVYGLGPGEYARLYAVQGGKCAVLYCRATGTGRRKLAVDHDHRTGAVRGLLCSTHNQMLGDAGDDPTVFRSIAEYLECPPAQVVV